MSGSRTVPVLDIPRLAKDDYPSTVQALQKYRRSAFPGVTYAKYRANLRHAVERPSARVREQVLESFKSCRNEVETKNNLECFLLTEEKYSTLNSRCWPMDAIQVHDQTGLVLRMPQCVVRFDVDQNFSAVVFPQPRKSYAPTEAELALLGTLIRRIWVPEARDVLFGPHPDMRFIVEFVDLGARHSGGARIPRILRFSEESQLLDDAEVNRKLANLARALLEEPAVGEDGQPDISK